MAKKPSNTGTIDGSARVVLMHGPEVFLHARYTRQVRAAVEKAHGTPDVIRFDGGSAAPAEILDECRSFGLMATHKVVVVDQAEAAVKDTNRALFERYAQGPTESATLVLRATRWYAGKLDAMIAEVGAVLECAECTPATALGWVKALAKEHRASIDEETARALVERVGVSLGRLDTELAKLAVAADASGGAITADHIAMLVGRSRDEEAWAIQSTLLSGDAEAGLTQLRDMLRVSRVPAQQLSFAYVDLARKLHAASRSMRGGARAGDLMRALRLWGSSGERLIEAARRVDPERALRLFRACVEADAKGKSGSDPEVNLETLTLRFAGVVRR